VRLAHRRSTERAGRHGRARTVRFEVGIRRVHPTKHLLWLAVAHGHGGGRSWFLTNLTGSGGQIVTETIRAYGERRCVEEYHRQIKQDFRLEEIAVRTMPPSRP